MITQEVIEYQIEQSNDEFIIEQVTNKTEISQGDVIAVTSNLNPEIYYTKEDIENKLLNKLNINSYIDGGEF